MVSDGERSVGLALEIKHRPCLSFRITPKHSYPTPASLAYPHGSDSTRRFGGGYCGWGVGLLVGCWAVGAVGMCTTRAERRGCRRCLSHPCSRFSLEVAVSSKPKGGPTLISVLCGLGGGKPLAPHQPQMVCVHTTLIGTRLAVCCTTHYCASTTMVRLLDRARARAPRKHRAKLVAGVVLIGTRLDALTFARRLEILTRALLRTGASARGSRWHIMTRPMRPRQRHASQPDRLHAGI